MNKLISKAAILTLGLALAAGVGVAVGSKKASVVRADEELEQSFDLTSSLPDGLTSSVALLPDTNSSHRGMGKGGADFTITTSNSFDSVSKVVVTAATNYSGYSDHSISVTVGGNAFDTSKSFTAKNLTDYEFAPESTESGVIVVSLDNSKDGTTKSNTIWVKTIQIFVDEGGEVVTKYVVTYDANGGTVSPTSEKVEENGHPSLPTPTRNKYTFLGWKVNGEGEYVTSSYEVTSAITLVASWLKDSSGAVEEEIVFSELGLADMTAVSPIDGDSCQISFSQGTHKDTAPKYYSNGESIRVYGGNTFTVSSEQNIASITLGFGSSDGSLAISTDVGTFTSPTWEGSALSVTFSVASGSGNRRLASMTIVYEVEPIPGYTAEQFAQQLLDATGPICATFDGQSKKAELLPIWAELAGSTRYAGLPTDQKTILIETEGDESGDTIARAMARYDYLVAKYGLTNFISGHVVKASFYFEDNALSIGNSNVLIIVISIASASVLAFSALMLLKKKKQK